jgi:hypothetical protein
MAKKLFLHCPLGHGEQYLKERFGNESLFMTALGSVFDLDVHDFAESLIYLLLHEEITEIFHVHDIESPILHSVVNMDSSFNSTSHLILKSLFEENYFEIIQESNNTASLALIHMKHQASLLFQHPTLTAIIVENKIALYGVLSHISKRKSIQFDLKMAFQQL